MLIVTLSSIPPRFALIGPTLESLLQQDRRPDRILVYIPLRYRRFPNWDGTLPNVPSGVEIRRADHDFGPATKILPAVRDFEHDDVELLFCDDDRLYPKDWTSIFIALRAAHPSAALCRIGRHAETLAESAGTGRRHPRAVRRWRLTDWRFQLKFLWHQARAGRNWRQVRAPHRKVYKRSGYIDVFEGFGGVMVRPGFFDAAAFDIPEILWTVDDVWLSGMVTRNGIPIWLEANLVDPMETDADTKAPLAQSVIDNATRDQANAMAVGYMQKTHGIWL